VYDDKGVLISASQWNLGTGFKATIILVKNNSSSTLIFLIKKDLL
jgi:hypothetical protein